MLANIADAFGFVPKPRPALIFQTHEPDIPGQGTIIAPTESVGLAVISLLPGAYFLSARFNLEVNNWGEGQTVANTRTVLVVPGGFENGWNRIRFVLNYSPPSVVVTHMLGVRVAENTTAQLRVLGDPYTELLATDIVLAAIPLDRLLLTTRNG